MRARFSRFLTAPGCPTVGARMIDSIRSRIETLEARIAPAVVTVSFTNGVLTLTGESGDHAFSIEAFDATSIELFAETGTTFKLGNDPAVESLRFTGPLKSLTASFGSGLQAMAFYNLTVAGDITLNLGEGANLVSFNGLSANGGLSIIGGSSDDDIMFSGGEILVKKGVSFNLGAGANDFGSNAGIVKIGKDFTITAAAGGDSATFEGGPVAIGGNATFELGDGIVRVATSRFTVGKSLLVDNTTSALGDPDTGLYLGGFLPGPVSSAGTILVNGNITYLGGAGSDQFSIGTIGQFKAKGVARFSAGAGAAEVTLSAIALSIGRLEIDAATAGDLDLGGTVYHAKIPGGVQIVSGSGDDEIETQFFAANLGPIDLQLGDGENATAISFVSSKVASLSVSGGTADDDATIVLVSSQVKGNVHVQNGGGGSATVLSGLDATVGGLIHVESAAHAGELADLTFNNFNNYTGFFKAGGIVFSPGDGGASVLRFQGVRDLTVKGSISALGGTGDDTVVFQNTMNVRVGKGFNFALGDGVNGATGSITNLFTSGFRFTGGAGSDSIDLGASGNLGVVTMELGAGPNGARFGGMEKPVAMKAFSLVSASLAGQNDSVLLSDILVSGAVTAHFGAGVSSVGIKDGFIGGALDINTGAGSDSVSLDVAQSGPGLTFAKPVLIELGDGNDLLTIGGNGVSALAIARATFRANGGEGTDVLENPVSNVFKKEPEFIGFEA